MRFPSLLLASSLALTNGAFSEETFPAANDLERTLVAKEPLLKNPISVSVDVDGKIYVTETTRRKVADLDIRDFYKFGWVPEDLSHTSIDDKRAFYEEQLDGSKKFPKTSLKDRNKDGKIDIKDLTELSEKVIQISDTNGDGIMDKSIVFAEGFNTEVTGIAAGTLAWRGDVYATIAPDVWKLRDTDGDGKADTRESLAHGFGVHIAYAGHDMHGLILGPDGKLYWSIGDKGSNVTSKEGKNFFAPHEGAVLRCNPDGTEFEIFARGLRNPQEIAFDKYGNLFSVDNDADKPGERERFVHITEASDTGWRAYYQYRGSAYDPWMDESLWEPEGEFQPAYITPTNQNYSDGPAGFAYNPGTALNAKYDDAFFVTEFPKGNLRSFKVKAKGASFEMTDEHTVYSGPKNVGINFGPDGALYSVDWSGGYPLNDKGAIWKLDDPIMAKSEIRNAVAEMLLAGPDKVATKDLIGRLSHKDMRIRLDAQWELAKRSSVSELEAVSLDPSSEQISKIHSLWGLAQGKYFSEKIFAKLSTSPDEELRAQVAKYAGEASQQSVQPLIAMLSDTSPRVRFMAATAIWKLGMSEALDATIEMLAENNNSDAYLRHAGVLAMTASSAEVIATKTLNHTSPAVRLAAAVAFRRLKSPLAAKLLLDENPKVAAEAAHVIYDDPAIEEAYPQLAAMLTQSTSLIAPAARRSIAANRRMGDLASAERLTRYSLDQANPSDLRIAALEALATWPESFVTDPVDGRHNPFEPADTQAASAAFSAASVILSTESEKAIATAAAGTSKELGIIASEQALADEASDTKIDAEVRLRALEALAPKRSNLFKKTAKSLLADRTPEVRAGAAELLAESDSTSALEYAKDALAKSKNLREKQRAVTLLGKSKESIATQLLTALRKQAQKNPKQSASAYEPGLLLELIAALPEPESDDLKSTLSDLGPTDQYFQSFAGGNASAGETVFNEHLAAQCTACHRIGPVGSEVGPPLTEAGKKGREYIFESLVSPQAKLSPGYGLMAVKTKSGISISGGLKEENEETLVLILPDKTEETINLASIETRTKPVSSMPPMGQILSPEELRDLVEYLSLQK